MRSFCKKSLSVILAVVMTLSLASIAFAKGDSWLQTTTPNEDGTLTIIGMSDEFELDEDGKLDLVHKLVFDESDPSLDMLNTGVGFKAFCYNEAVVSDYNDFLTTIKEIAVEEGICDIDKYAFGNLPNLEKVTFAGDVKLAGNAFENCPALETVVFEKKADVAANAFVNCAALKKVTFNGDAKLADNAFAGCTALETINIADDASFTGSKNALADTAYVRNYSVDFVMVGSTLIYYKGNDAEVTIPLNVTAIGSSAFEGNKNIKTVNITKYVDTLGDRAFYNCENLKTVNFSDYGEITTVGSEVFDGTYYYENYDCDFFIVGSILIKYIGDEAYVAIPNTITEIAPDCFDGCYSAKNPDGYTWVVSAIFVPASLTTFGENCFGLAELEDGTHYIPRLYAYTGTASEAALIEAGYTPTAMPGLGDVDNDGDIDVADARLALRMAVKLDVGADPLCKHAADITCNSVVEVADARQILRVAVGLDYTQEDLLYTPISDLEIVMAYTKAMKTVALYGAGYTKKTENVVTGYDMNGTAKSNLYNTLATTACKNETVVYAPDTAAALENIDFCTLLSTDEIKNAECILEEGKYYITIQFNDTVDTDGSSDIFKAIPVHPLKTFTDKFAGKKWMTPIPNNTYKLNGIVKFALAYSNPTITLVVEQDTYKIVDCKLSCGYQFNIDGYINGLGISSFLYKTGDATLNRQDTITYSNFVYNNDTVAED